MLPPDPKGTPNFGKQSPFYARRDPLVRIVSLPRCYFSYQLCSLHFFSSRTVFTFSFHRDVFQSRYRSLPRFPPTTLNPSITFSSIAEPVVFLPCFRRIGEHPCVSDPPPPPFQYSEFLVVFFFPNSFMLRTFGFGRLSPRFLLDRFLCTAPLRPPFRFFFLPASTKGSWFSLPGSKVSHVRKVPLPPYICVFDHQFCSDSSP